MPLEGIGMFNRTSRDDGFVTVRSTWSAGTADSLYFTGFRTSVKSAFAGLACKPDPTFGAPKHDLVAEAVP